jgi:hypothetical protein
VKNAAEIIEIYNETKCKALKISLGNPKHVQKIIATSRDNVTFHKIKKEHLFENKKSIIM